MGYRSNVAFCFKKKPELIIPMNIDKVMDVIAWDCVLDRVDSVLCHVEGIKWYEGYKEVDKVMEFLRSLDEEDYLFIRLGEENADVEHEGQWWDNPFNLGYVREIIFTDPVEQSKRA